MIKNKKDYLFYLEADRKARNYPQKLQNKYRCKYWYSNG